MEANLRNELEGLLLDAWESGGCLVLPRGETGARRRALGRAVEEGWCVSPGSGMFAPTALWNALRRDSRHLALARGLQRLHPDWVFCGPTAGVALGLSVSWTTIEKVHVATTRGAYRRESSTAEFHPIRERRLKVVEAGGLRVTSLERTVLDCLRWMGFAHAMAVADSALRMSGPDGEKFVQRVLSLGRGLHGLKRVEDVLLCADPRAESGGESIARARMCQLGFSCPELQVEVPPVTRDSGEYRVDFLWKRSDGRVIVGELDGAEKRTNPQMTEGRTVEQTLMDERLRESRITLYDVAVLRFSYAQTCELEKFAQLLDDFGVPRAGSPLALPPGVPTSVDWESLRRR